MCLLSLCAGTFVCLRMVRVCMCVCVWVPLASLVSYRVSDYPMGALIELDTLLIVSLKEGEGEGRKGEQSAAAGLDNFCRAGDTGEWCRYLQTAGFQLHSSSLIWILARIYGHSDILIQLRLGCS